MRRIKDLAIVLRNFLQMFFYVKNFLLFLIPKKILFFTKECFFYQKDFYFFTKGKKENPAPCTLNLNYSL